MQKVNEELLKEVKSYLRAEDEIDEEIIPLINAAKRIMRNAGIKEDEDNPEYIMALKLITSQYYEKRLPSGSNQNKSFVLSLNSLLIQLSRE